MYTRANVAAHVLGKRVPVPTHRALTAWFREGGAKGRAQVSFPSLLPSLPLSLPPLSVLGRRVPVPTDGALTA